MIGETLGSYRVIAKIGEGGMGAVYLGEHPLIGRKAAVKVLRPEYSNHSDAVARFFREAKLTASLKHPALVDVFDFGVRPDGSAYLIMDYLEGESLEERLQRAKPSMPTCVEIARQIAIGMSVAHAAGIVHRDLKPGNVFLTPDPSKRQSELVKILDFGIAKLTNRGTGAPESTRTDIVLGTPLYMAPEQCKGSSQVDQRADIYAFGCVMYRMIGGRPPFAHQFPGELIAAHIHETPEALRVLDPSVPPALEAIVVKALAKRPDERQQTMDEVVAELEHFMATDPAWASRAGVGASGSSMPPAVALPPRQSHPSISPSARSREVTPPPDAASWSAHPAPGSALASATPPAQSTMMAPSRPFDGTPGTRAVAAPQAAKAAPFDAQRSDVQQKDPAQSTLSRGAASIADRAPAPSSRRGTWAVVMVAATMAAASGALVLLRLNRASDEPAGVNAAVAPHAAFAPASPPDPPVVENVANPLAGGPAVFEPANAASAAPIEAPGRDEGKERDEVPKRAAVPPVAPHVDVPRPGTAQPSAGRTPTGNVVRIAVSNARPGLVAKVDGRMVPFPLRLPKDMQPHEVTFETPNFRPEKHTIRADRDQTLTLDNKPSFYVP